MTQTADLPDFPPASQAHKTLRASTFWRLAEEIPKPLNWTLMGISIALPVLLWSIATMVFKVDAKFLPSPGQVWEAGQRLWSSGELWKDTTASLYRVLVGFLLAIVISVPLGTLMGSFASLRALFEPMIGLLRYMPAPAFIPLLILYLGIDEQPKIVLIFIGTLFFNTLMVMDAVKFVPKELIETSYTLGGNRLQVLLRVIFPYIMPSVIDASRVNIAAAWQLVIVSELIAATEGLGRRISVAGRFLRTDEIFVGLLVIGLIGLAIDLLFRLLLRFSCRWAVD